MSCETISWMQLFAAGFAGMAAVLWLVASLVKMPSTAPDELSIGNMGEISKSFAKQGRLNAAAAVCAAFSAALQAILVYAPTCINFG
jgi:hypothetical protein